MSMEPIPSNSESSDVEQVPDVGDEGLFSGTKIDSEEEALASDVPVEPTTISSDVLGAIYTLGMWRVKPGQRDGFITAWQALGDIFRQLPQPPAGKGTLVQSVSDPLLFYSFGPWLSLADIEAMRQNAQAQAGLEILHQFCTEAHTGVYRTVAEVDIET